MILESATELLNIYSTSHFITKNIKNMCTHSSKFNAINNDTALARSFLSELGILCTDP